MFVLCVPQKEIANNDLTDIVPCWVWESHVKLTVNCLKNVGNDEADWIRGNIPNDTQIKSLIGLVVAAAVDYKVLLFLNPKGQG